MDGKGGGTKKAARGQRLQLRQQRRRQQIAEAATPEARLSLAFDWFRASAGHLGKAGISRTGVTPNRSAAVRILNEMADYLAAAAAGIDARGEES